MTPPIQATMGRPMASRGAALTVAASARASAGAASGGVRWAVKRLKN